MERSTAVAVLCPSRYEYAALDRARLAERGVTVLLSGMGKVRAAIGCHRLTALRPGLKHIVLVGFAGGLTASLGVGDVVEPLEVIEQDYCAEPFEEFPNSIRRKGGRLLGSVSVDALMLTQDRFLTENPHRGGPLERRHPRISCDMESYAVAAFCRETGLGCSIIKIVSDSADANADHDFLKACRELSPKLNRIVQEAVEKLGARRSAVRAPKKRA
ncbi:MAG: 5'-methylthioadenosine/S-adenosylhomocysteine nucleosidase [Candidatus Omnitrophica bacterium]|nr:5'-methylthioadenosine/S-adenosylhomocysteine nucleosidase [Candidatus Omnitrophota bacterium]